ncbi:protein licC [Pasteurellaceae bacterium Pebbles2]|nr:protein licC [Pasteurellaceae bacterium Pebbles2]
MNAILLAAGLGSRFKEITQKTHKALLPINGIPNIERTIQFLLEAKISNIYIVTGYHAQQFEYLTQKYPVKLLFNAKYQEWNSIYSLYQALDYFSDSYVIDADVVVFNNIFKEKPKQSCYFTIQRENKKEEWIPVLSDNKRVLNIEISKRYAPSLLGISYWTHSDCEKIKAVYSKFTSEDVLLEKSLYWDNIPMSILEDLNVTTIQLSSNDGYEMDNFEEYQFILEKNNEKYETN